MTAQDIHGWFVALLAIVAVGLAVAMPIVAFLDRKSARTKQADRAMPDYTAIGSLQRNADDFGHNHGGDGHGHSGDGH